LTLNTGVAQNTLMKKSELLEAPQVEAAPPTADKWEQERRAFRGLRPSLLRTHQNQYVAVHHGKVVESGDDEIALGMRVYARFGYVPIYVGLVSDEPEPVVRIPGPRLKSMSS
jgi:hypothetical protein